ncbi:TetR/AcrR family transcriptional regulator [candidate division WOR-3 bacterium]|nr:TetR/AcrR family transcriptional regulator [candidate division WOR-3 bacterium]
MCIRDKILNESMKLFLEHGYNGVSLNMILNACNISKGGFYHYFKSKEMLFNELMEERIFKEISAPNEPLSGNISAQSKIRSVIDYSFRYIAEIKNLIGEDDFFGIYPLLFQGVINNKNLLRKLKLLYKGYIELITKILKEGINNGEFSGDFNPRKMAYQLIFSIEGDILVWSITKDFNIKKHFDLTYDNFLKIIK